MIRRQPRSTRTDTPFPTRRSSDLWFHRPSRAVLTATPSVAGLLRAHGLCRTRLWGRGVDLDCFHPEAPPCAAFEAMARPIQLYVGRVSVEKNIEAFLGSSHPGSKIVVGDGPARDWLMRRYPEVRFPGALHGPALAAAYAGADVLVFPSMTDTYGLVMIEALACGTPVAAYPRSEEHTSELQSLMRTSYSVFCLKKQNTHIKN